MYCTRSSYGGGSSRDSDGDMRQALNNLLATLSGFRFFNQGNVFKTSDSSSHLKTFYRVGSYLHLCSLLAKLAVVCEPDKAA
ncbi:hypothetical protein AALP_AA2G007500 [Arabis alpina]|uniref:Uncharacterized protein n=1 Tax=Arabis alpina TaxID=50452 RepID=A0A087HEH6_ARAAL|nr:hypothetical protein AALP_AA2G007500 [Arabis alpina]